ncbi:breast cancer metastasis-suppressor 1-like protein isoform X2 [Neophocaena asiaeorientalis asiaeorientalis]|uniref:Breast cancer metastasis-suppressor 1-like protein isoform X2 n=2 Tax=Phocoenidae TaxID=9740 RepID=A0A341CVJ4_NEOAA|nr:breast cancer metastasis-suppressor 1-like protein isoform X2 [Neophocaena asiaeorientalis asiaeorientalis]XP_026966885.1 breast cancer metastasis-suppressor 1-like protein isoform X2 [Lagenorhynchus obliquidens]XP_032480353.1 breast cancer metastasis-suppressor 1-like protein isoform X3 [Phocoena sinus]XP_049561899.1 breast cancer metastasis-suppressor 1-like protein isoform X2 [Orcinus orca]XP_059875811.1 breast cancer metastasis-suppressor 1-like protein [Delphinus delphis]
MPVHSRGDKKETNHHDEMEVDYAENEGSSSEDEDTESSSVSEDGDSSEMDDEDCERRRMECLDEMSNLEKQFTDLKDQLYKERLSQVDAKLQEVIAGKAPEYLEPLATLQENMQIRTKVAGIYRELCLESVKNKYECEIQASRQHCEVYFLLLEEHPRHSFTESLLVSEKLLLYDTVQSELEEKIRRLEEDRHSIDITSELWNDELQSRKKRKDPFSPDKKKPVVVSGPYIVYMLQDLDILEDWTTIRKAMATLGPHRVKTEPPVKLEKHLHSARSEEGRLYYDGEWYIRGQTICIDKKDECPTSAVITTINHDEVWFKRPDGSKSKLYISQLQKGKYSIKHS